MELEATILERLQELRQWQVEQQERLLKQQQEQRELLTFEQDRMYQALGLSVQGIALEDSLTERASPSPGKYRNNESNTEEVSVDELSKHDSRRDSYRAKDSITVCKEGIANEVGNQQRIELNIPPLQLNTNRHLSLKSSIEGFSPFSEMPSDREPSVVTISSERTPEKSRRSISELSMEGVEPLPLDKPLDKPPNKRVTIDDLPVPSPRKDFKTMLEEQLRECETDPTMNNSQASKPLIKRPFLKKGEGLARFKPNRGEKASNRRGRPRSSSLSASTHLSSASAAKNTAAKLKDTPKSSRTAGASGKPQALPLVAQSKLNLRNVPPPKKKVRSKSMSAVSINKPSVNNLKIIPSVDINTSSDFETKSRRELEEMRIFELLEEKAENSSFCSNSSTVLALFRQSTPLKPKSMQKNIRNPKQRLMNESNKHESSDTSLEEIVLSTKSNRSVTASPVTKIRETVIQKDIVFSKWDSGPFPDENINANSSPNNRGLHRALAAGTYKATQHTKHTTIQFNNNNNSNSNNNVRKPVVHSDEEEDVCDSSRDTNYCDVVDNMRENNDEKPVDKDEANVSLHVRFSEYNEYKTIGLTDTSIMSNDPNPSRDCMDDKAWSDRSTSPDSSDAEILYSNNANIAKGLPLSLQNVESHSCGEESTDQTTDDEQYTSTCCSNDTSYDADDTISEMKVDRPKERVNPVSEDESELCNDSGSTIRQENDEVATNTNGIDSVDVNGTIFKSELLKKRLLELEREIYMFRKENEALANQRKKLQEEQRQLQKEYKQKEENLEKEKKCAEESMQDEKRRLSREKSALENRLRDAREKSLQTKQERHEIQILREQLDELKEETSQKESRWQAAQARQKSQIRVLQTENAKFKQELEKLRLSRSNNARSRRFAPPSNTRAIHQINKQLDCKKKVSPKKDSSSDEDTARAQIIYRECEVEEVQADEIDQIGIVDEDGSKMIVYNGTAQQSVKSDEDIRQKRNLYTNLLNEATEGLRGREELAIGKCTETFEKSMNKSQSSRFNDKEDRIDSTNNESVSQRNSDNTYKRSYENSVEHYKSAGILLENDENRNGRPEESCGSPVARNNHANQKESQRSPEFTPSGNDRASIAVNKQDIREVQCPDGHIEYWYPNGNVKKIFPDRNVTKMIYYNGDVRESAEDGSVKYFYASTRTWHTTMPDGLEILEFPDGQVERRTKNGTTEVSFPDGSVRLLQSDGTEKWVLPDGTIAETFPDGDRVLSFPNGQREVHTKEHKRREYPDGTIKLVYPDGTQETRYSTGRVRVKDKDGNLLMDIHHR